MAKAIEFNAETGVEIVRDLTEEESNHYQTITEYQSLKEQADSEKENKKKLLFEKLGITAEEAKLLLS